MKTNIIAKLSKLKNPVTAVQLADKLKTSESSVRNALNALVKEGVVAIVGTKKNGPGRPSNLYSAKA